MSLPNKKRGFRRIVVDFIDYDWRYFSQYRKICLDVRLSTKPRNKLIINLDSEDPWLQMRENISTHNLHPCSAPITPKFVTYAVKESLALGWKPKIQSLFASELLDSHATHRERASFPSKGQF
ncbi:MAG: hypothetical protein AAF383_28010 [Cyanobacteria bacterium P01_A01_bin.83]